LNQHKIIRPATMCERSYSKQDRETYEPVYYIAKYWTKRRFPVGPKATKIVFFQGGGEQTTLRYNISLKKLYISFATTMQYIIKLGQLHSCLIIVSSCLAHQLPTRPYKLNNLITDDISWILFSAQEGSRLHLWLGEKAICYIIFL
jgi:hypothetical protein